MNNNVKLENLLTRYRGRGVLPVDFAGSAAEMSSAEQVQDLIKKHKLTTRELEYFLTPDGRGADKLTLGQNARVLADQAKRTLQAGPRATLNALKDNLKTHIRGNGSPYAGIGAVTRHMAGQPIGLGIGALNALHQAASTEDPSGRQRGRAERIGGAAGSLIGGLATTLPAHAMQRLGMAGIPANMLTSALGAKAGGAIGGLIGRGIGKVAPKRKRKAELERA